MKIDKEVLKLFKHIRKYGTETVEVNANGRIYNVEVDVYNIFTQNCTESPEDFLTRIQPKDDDEASYRMSLHVSALLRERHKE